MFSKSELSFLTSLKQKKYRLQCRKFIVENAKVIFEEINNPLLENIFLTEGFLTEHKKELAGNKFKLISIAELKKVSTQVTPQGILAIFKQPSLSPFDFKEQNIFILDNIQDPGNLGAIIRTADWFGFKNLFLGRECVEVYNPKVVAAAMGSIFHLRPYENVDLKKFIGDLKSNGYKILVTDLKGKEVEIEDFQKMAVIIGNEAHGVDEKIKKLADLKLKIAKFGRAESLNAAVAAGILMDRIKS